MPPLAEPFLVPGSPPPAPTLPPSPPEQWPTQPWYQPPNRPTPGVPAPPGRSGDDRRRALVAAAIGAVAIVLIGAIVLSNRDDDSRLLADRSSSSRSSTFSRSSDSSDSSDSAGSDSTESDSSVPPPTTEPESFDAVVEDIKAFVERERGLKFTKDVPVDLAGEGDFQNRLLAEFDKEKDSLLEEQEVLVSLGLIEPGSDLVQLERELLDAGVVGFYDPETGELVVRGTDPTPYVRQVMAHELTHALDDEHFNLNRPQLDTADDETGFGFLGLVEGNARRIEDAYVESMSPQDQSKAFDEQLDLLDNAPALFTLPPILITLIQEPYEQGPVFVNALLDDGGQARLDAAFASPPSTSEQVLDPSVYLRGEGAVPVATPTPDGAQSNKGVIGAFLLRELLASGGVSGREVDTAVTGWGGDAYVTWHDDQARSCIKATFAGDTPTDTDEIATALEDWRSDSGATVDRSPDGGSVTVVRCA
jgi:hypothetical protein